MRLSVRKKKESMHLRTALENYSLDSGRVLYAHCCVLYRIRKIRNSLCRRRVTTVPSSGGIFIFLNIFLGFRIIFIADEPGYSNIYISRCVCVCVFYRISSKTKCLALGFARTRRIKTSTPVSAHVQNSNNAVPNY